MAGLRHSDSCFPSNQVPKPHRPIRGGFRPHTEKRWAAALLQQAMTGLREEFETSGKGRIFDQLKLFLEGEASSGDYAAMAAGLGMSANAIAVSVHRLRQRYRELVRIEVANTVDSPDEVEDEMRHLFSVLAQ